MSSSWGPEIKRSTRGCALSYSLPFSEHFPQKGRPVGPMKKELLQLRMRCRSVQCKQKPVVAINMYVSDFP